MPCEALCGAEGLWGATLCRHRLKPTKMELLFTCRIASAGIANPSSPPCEIMKSITYPNKILPCGLGWDRDTKSTAPPILFLQSPPCSGPLQVFFHLARSLSIADERGGAQSIIITRLIEGESTRQDNLIPGTSQSFSPSNSVHADSRGLLQEGAYFLG